MLKVILTMKLLGVDQHLITLNIVLTESAWAQVRAEPVSFAMQRTRWTSPLPVLTEMVLRSESDNSLSAVIDISRSTFVRLCPDQLLWQLQALHSEAWLQELDF